MDPLKIGRGVGSVLPEAVKEAGAVGVLLNHAERPLSLEVIEANIKRADEVGLAGMVCAGDLAQVEAIARMGPNVVLAESPALIGVGKRQENDGAAVAQTNELVWGINPDIRVLHGAGISNGKDVYDIILAGSQGAGSTSGILLAPDPFQMLEEMIGCVRAAWDRIH